MDNSLRSDEAHQLDILKMKYHLRHILFIHSNVSTVVGHLTKKCKICFDHGAFELVAGHPVHFISSISSLSVLSVLWGPLVLYFNSAAVSFCFWVIKSSVQSATAVGCICIDMCSNICVALSWLTSVAVALLRLFESRGRFNLNKISSLRATV